MRNRDPNLLNSMAGMMSSGNKNEGTSPGDSSNNTGGKE